MASSKFVTATLNGMFITHLTAWMTTSIASATIATDRSSPSNPTLLGRANDDPSSGLNEEWDMVIPIQAQSGNAVLTPTRSQYQIGVRDDG